MICEICGRNSGTRSFHSLSEQDLFDLRKTMPDDVDLLRRMVQEGAAEILVLKEKVEELEMEIRVMGETD